MSDSEESNVEEDESIVGHDEIDTQLSNCENEQKQQQRFDDEVEAELATVAPRLSQAPSAIDSEFDNVWAEIEAPPKVSFVIARICLMNVSAASDQTPCAF